MESAVSSHFAVLILDLRSSSLLCRELPQEGVWPAVALVTVGCDSGGSGGVISNHSCSWLSKLRGRVDAMTVVASLQWLNNRSYTTMM